MLFVGVDCGVGGSVFLFLARYADVAAPATAAEEAPLHKPTLLLLSPSLGSGGGSSSWLALCRDTPGLEGKHPRVWVSLAASIAALGWTSQI